MFCIFHINWSMGAMASYQQQPSGGVFDYHHQHVGAWRLLMMKLLVLVVAASPRSLVITLVEVNTLQVLAVN